MPQSGENWRNQSVGHQYERGKVGSWGKRVVWDYHLHPPATRSHLWFMLLEHIHHLSGYVFAATIFHQSYSNCDYAVFVIQRIKVLCWSQNQQFCYNDDLDSFMTILFLNWVASLKQIKFQSPMVEIRYENITWSNLDLGGKKQYVKTNYYTWSIFKRNHWIIR